MDRGIYMIKFDNVVKKYGDKNALDGFSWHVKEGEIHGLLGHNGSGKTTSCMIANRMIKYTEGEVLVLGKKVENLSSNDIQNIGLLTEKLKLYKDLTIKETLEFFCDIFDIKNKKETIDQLAKRFDFNKYINKMMKNLSTGMYKKVAIAITFINNPKIVFLDEPFSGLDPVIVKQISTILKGYRDENNTTIIVSSHNLHEIEEISDRITIMKSGKQVISENIGDLYRKYGIDKSYSLSYLTNHKETTETLNDENELAEKLVSLKAENAVILKIKENKIKLTDIYNKIYS